MPAFDTKNPFGRVWNEKTHSDTLNKRIYTVFILFNNLAQWQPFHCPDCRFMICRYKGMAVMEMPGGTLHNTVPVEIKCPNPNCGRRVIFQDAMYEDESGK